MKVTVCFGENKVVVPCGIGDITIRSLARNAFKRVKHTFPKLGFHDRVVIHSVSVARDGGMLDWDDLVGDVLDDRELVNAQFSIATLSSDYVDSSSRYPGQYESNEPQLHQNTCSPLVLDLYSDSGTEGLSPQADIGFGTEKPTLFHNRLNVINDPTSNSSSSNLSLNLSSGSCSAPVYSSHTDSQAELPIGMQSLPETVTCAGPPMYQSCSTNQSYAPQTLNHQSIRNRFGDQVLQPSTVTQSIDSTQMACSVSKPGHEFFPSHQLHTGQSHPQPRRQFTDLDWETYDDDDGEEDDSDSHQQPLVGNKAKDPSSGTHLITTASSLYPSKLPSSQGNEPTSVAELDEVELSPACNLTDPAGFASLYRPKPKPASMHSIGDLTLPFIRMQNQDHFDWLSDHLQSMAPHSSFSYRAGSRLNVPPIAEEESVLASCDEEEMSVDVALGGDSIQDCCDSSSHYQGEEAAKSILTAEAAGSDGNDDDYSMLRPDYWLEDKNKHKAVGKTATTDPNSTPSKSSSNVPDTSPTTSVIQTLTVKITNSTLGQSLGIQIKPSLVQNPKGQGDKPSGYIESGLEVHNILPNGRIARQGCLLACDRILAINGESLDGVNFERARDIFQKALSDPELTLLVERRVTKKPMPPPPPPRRSPSTSLTSKQPSSNVSQPDKGLPGFNLIHIVLEKGAKGLGFSLTSREVPIPDGKTKKVVLVKSILPGGAALLSGELQSEDHLLQVDGLSVDSLGQPKIVALLREKPINSKVELLIARAATVTCERVATIHAGNQFELSSDQYTKHSIDPVQFIILQLDIDISRPSLKSSQHQSTSSNRDPHPITLGLSVAVHAYDLASTGTGDKSEQGSTETDFSKNIVLVRMIIPGGLAHKDGRIQVNDRLLMIDTELLSGLSSSVALSRMKSAISRHLSSGLPSISLVLARRRNASSSSTATTTTAVTSSSKPNRLVADSGSMTTPSSTNSTMTTALVHPVNDNGGVSRGEGKSRCQSPPGSSSSSCCHIDPSSESTCLVNGSSPASNAKHASDDSRERKDSKSRNPISSQNQTDATRPVGSKNSGSDAALVDRSNSSLMTDSQVFSDSEADNLLLPRHRHRHNDRTSIGSSNRSRSSSSRFDSVSTRLVIRQPKLDLSQIVLVPFDASSWTGPVLKARSQIDPKDLKHLDLHGGSRAHSGADSIDSDLASKTLSKRASIGKLFKSIVKTSHRRRSNTIGTSTDPEDSSNPDSELPPPSRSKPNPIQSDREAALCSNTRTLVNGSFKWNNDSSFRHYRPPDNSPSNRHHHQTVASTRSTLPIRYSTPTFNTSPIKRGVVCSTPPPPAPTYGNRQIYAELEFSSPPTTPTKRRQSDDVQLPPPMPLLLNRTCPTTQAIESEYISGHKPPSPKLKNDRKILEDAEELYRFLAVPGSKDDIKQTSQIYTSI